MAAILAVSAAPTAAQTGADESAPSADGGQVGIRLLEAPAVRAEAPRARSYIVDHLLPGTIIDRRIEITNTTARALEVALYPGDAAIEDGERQVDDAPVDIAAAASDEAGAAAWIRVVSAAVTGRQTAWSLRGPPCRLPLTRRPVSATRDLGPASGRHRRRDHDGQPRRRPRLPLGRRGQRPHNLGLSTDGWPRTLSRGDGQMAVPAGAPRWWCGDSGPAECESTTKVEEAQ